MLLLRAPFIIIAVELLYRDTFTPVLSVVKVSEHAGSSKSHNESIGASSTYFLKIITVPLHWHEIPFHV